MANEIPYVRDLSFEYGKPVEVAKNVRRVIADNPGPFTYVGSGTYIVGRDRVAVIDPGPRNPAHIAALLAALEGEEIAHILVTHTHADHSGGVPLLAAQSGAPTYAFGPHKRHNPTAADPLEEGADWEFVPDHLLSEGDTLEGVDYQLTALHTPGHCSNHLCFALRDGKTLFTGDHVMGWATSVIGPPDGDMGDYLKNLERLLSRDDARYLPTHGPSIEDPKPLVSAYLAHRRAREAQVLACLARGVRRISDMVPELYSSVPKELHPAAALSLYAHVLALHAQGRIASDGDPQLDAEYRLTP